ncbi:MAG: hypothetical protein QXJ73_08800 [Candidatus Caldarchaeum sp.]
MLYVKATIHGWVPEAVENHASMTASIGLGCVANWTADALGQTTPAGG